MSTFASSIRNSSEQDASGIPDTSLQGYEDGQTDVRNSAEWKAMDEMIALGRRYCDFVIIGIDAQEAFTDLKDALRKFDRLRGEERG